MKYGLTSIILASIGILFVMWLNIEVLKLFKSEIIYIENQTELNPSVLSIGMFNKIITLGIAVLGIILGIKSKRSNKSYGVIGITLSLILIILTILPIWTYLL